MSRAVACAFGGLLLLAGARVAAADEPKPGEGAGGDHPETTPPAANTGADADKADPSGSSADSEPGRTPFVLPPQQRGEDPGDTFSWRVAGQTHVRLFQRAPVPGIAQVPPGIDTGAPLYQYLTLRVDNLDMPWQRDSVDVELAAWGDVEMGEVDAERRVDGDITLLIVRHRVGPARFVLGRQVVAGGAARFSRFDGASASVTSDFGLGVDAYGGFTVLPRWNARPGFQLLGSVADTLVKHPEALEEPSRERHWMAGIGSHYSYERWFQFGASFHEEHAWGGLARRDFGIDLRSDPLDELGVHGALLLDLDHVQVSQARIGIDAWPHPTLQLAAAFGHAVPGLLMSQQSVLSVFSIDAFDEGGLEAIYKPLQFLAFGVDGWIERFSDTSLGARGGLSASYIGDMASATLAYRRVVEGQSGDAFSDSLGYHGLRAALGVTPLEALRLTLEAHTYFYDRAVGVRPNPSIPTAARDDSAGRSLSWLTSLTGHYDFAPPVGLLLGGSVAQTPYAKLDAQALVRLDLDFRGGSQ